MRLLSGGSGRVSRGYGAGEAGAAREVGEGVTGHVTDLLMLIVAWPGRPSMSPGWGGDGAVQSEVVARRWFDSPSKWAVATRDRSLDGRRALWTSTQGKS